MSHYSTRNPWIPAREVSLCPWESDQIRGNYVNPYASLVPNIYRYSERQMDTYMNMLRQMGFTGVQFIDSCYSWARYGSPEAFHEAMIRMMKAARRAGLKVSLWVWAAFFGGHGWTDPNAVYDPQPGYTAYTDPKVHAFFEKYYNIYAELAPYVDMLIGHYFDPGMLKNNDDIIAYFKLLASKFRAVNPDVRLCMDTWGYTYGTEQGYAEALAQSNLGDCLILEQPSPAAWPGNSRAEFRSDLKKNGFQVGMWGWYTCEYETDQMAAMYVNGHVLKDRYQAIRSEADHVLHPVYWSEMDAGHLYNLYSLYSAAQLLIDPDRDPDELLREVVGMIWQGEDADTMYDTLKLIQEVRSGDRWDTYWWQQPDFRWGTGDNTSDLRRAEDALQRVSVLAEKRNLESVSLSLPFKPWVLAKLTLPHIEQIRLLCRFKDEIRQLSALHAAGATADQLYRKMSDILKPVPDFNTWVGNFLQIEQREQYRIANEFCKKVGIPLPKNPVRRDMLRRNAIETIAMFQRGMQEPYLFNSSTISFDYLAYPKDESIELIEEMYQDGVIEHVGDGKYRLTNWESHRFGFDVT